MEQIFEDGLVGEVIVVEESELREEKFCLVRVRKGKVEAHKVD